MSFIRIIHDGIPFVINLELIVSAGYKEANKHLDIRFSGGETMTLAGQDAERVWGLFSRESERDEVYYQEEVDDSDDDEASDDFEEINQEISDLEAQLTGGNITRPWTAERMRNNAKDFGKYWPSKKKKALAEEIKKVKEKAFAIADQAETVAYSNTINQCLTAAFTTSSSVTSTIKKLTEVQVELQRRKKLTPESKQKIREGKERAAQHRAKKKLAEAHVAKAGGSLIKYDKYKREAEAILKQDWETVFPKEQAPSLTSLETAESA